MMRYLAIYKAILTININAFFAYRGNFFNSILSSIVWGLFSIFSIILLTSRVQSLFGWSRDEIIMLTAMYSVVIGVFHMVFSRNFEYFSRVIDLGQLDSFLLKPVDSQFFLSTRFVNFASIIRIIMGILLMAYLLDRMGVSVSLLQVMLFLVFMICGIMLMYAIWYIIITLTIWASKLSNIVELLYSLSSISRYPPEMYKEISLYLFLFLLPLVLILATPVKFLFGRIDIGNAIIMVVLTGVLLFLSRKWWKFALKHYTSASG